MAIDYSTMIPKEDLTSFQQANPGKSFGAEDLAAYNDPTSSAYKLSLQSSSQSSYQIPQVQTTADAQVPNGTITIPTQTPQTFTTPTAEQLGAQFDATKPSITPEMQAIIDENNSYKNLLGLGEKAAKEKSQQFAQMGGNVAQSQVNQLTKDYMMLDQIAKGKEQAYLNARIAGGGGTAGGTATTFEGIQRENAVAKWSKLADIYAAQNNVDQAKAASEQAIQAKYGDIQAQIDYKKQYYDINKDTLTRLDKTNYDKQQYILQQQQKALDKKIADETESKKLIIDASPVAPPDVLARAKATQAKGGSATEVAMALGQYGGDFLKNKLLEEQLKTEVSQRDKIASDISVNNAQIRNYDANASKTKAETGALTGPNGVVSKPLTEVQAKDLLYAQRGEQANSIIGNLQNTVVSMNPTSFATQKTLESSSLTSGQVSSEIRQLRQAERNFATAVLRKESGAAISPTEFATVEKQYFPRPGDDVQTLAQKKMNRETYISGTKSGVPGYDQRVTTPESSYLDSVDASLKTVEQKTTPVSMYTSRLLGLPGVK